jgi:uncharacterized protein (UPF0333 family)
VAYVFEGEQAQKVFSLIFLVIVMAAIGLGSVDFFKKK